MCLNVSINVFTLIILAYFTLISAQVLKPKPKPTPFQDWDYLVLSQRWPITACMEWEEKSKTNKCNMPPKNDTWIVHGLWPTKNNTDGPYFCQSAVHFDIDQINPILNDLKANWTNIEGGTKPYSFWEHEWSKHGTCAIVLPQLDSVINYFEKGLELQVQYNIYDILSNKNITPENAGYTVQDLYTTVQKALNKNPIIDCISYKKASYIREIRICLDKNFNLIDCTSQDQVEDVLSNCSLKRPVLYLGHLNTTEEWYEEFDDSFLETVDYDDTDDLKANYENLRIMDSLINLYKMLKFVIWFTL